MIWILLALMAFLTSILLVPTVAAQVAQNGGDRAIFIYDWLTYLWVVTWAGIGGAVNFFQKVKAGVTRAFNLTEFVGELATSAFVGIITFMLCDWAKVDPKLSAVFIAVTGHMGSRALFVGEKFIQKYIEKKTGVIVDETGELAKPGVNAVDAKS